MMDLKNRDLIGRGLLVAAALLSGDLARADAQM